MDESGHSDALMMNDLLGTQAVACDAYAFFLRETGTADKAPHFEAEAARIRQLLDTVWWDEAEGRYYEIFQPDGSHAELSIDGVPHKAETTIDHFVRQYSFVDVVVADGQAVCVSKTE
ncbi:MAG: hypothetical protein HFE45_03305 [Oscillospiraceae bacterium]|jgi:hypothetical protein|nr:hypothetical protein [Oscillospiraceae bacterium]